MNSERYSKYIRPLLYVIDLSLVAVLYYFLLSQNLIDLGFVLLFWICLSVFLSIYSVYRFTNVVRIVSLFSRQVTLLVLLIVSYYYVRGKEIPITSIISFFIALLILINSWRVFLFEFFKRYRVITGSNSRQVIIIGINDSSRKLEHFFNNSPEFGYKFKGFFSDKEETDKFGSIEESFDFIIKNNIQEVYCSVKELTDAQIENFMEFCDINFKTLKFIADDKELFSKNLQLDYYDLTPIITIRKIPLDDPVKSLIKRIFDIIFSLLVIVFVLSWLTPILGILIKLESKGPIFFQQRRHGADFKLFLCYKFRSMTPNNEADETQASKNDSRITRIGEFMRRTSIDELPQFFNVLFGNMSVVGPRPLLISHTNDYKNKIDKFMLRHNVKPGITGLAQVSGYRGNIERDSDMHNRVRYDIFYVENWSLILDSKIITKTIINVVKGEDKAY